LTVSGWMTVPTEAAQTEPKAQSPALISPRLLCASGRALCYRSGLLEGDIHCKTTFHCNFER
jgi:hypothetical protein